MANQKLELTWIGKDDQTQVEPRILLHDPSKDYGDPDATNMLIHGDNLLALKALEQQFAGQVKCIYIDPPYNTGEAFEYYDVAQGLAKETKNNNLQGFVASNTGKAHMKFDEPEKALKSYSSVPPQTAKSSLLFPLR